MNRAMLVLMLASAVGCASGRNEQDSQRLQLVLPADSLNMVGGETRELAILVLGANADQATISGELPAFAKIAGSILTVSPARTDAGVYSLMLTATTGTDSVSLVLDVVVAAPNTPPTWDVGGIAMGDDVGVYGTEPCTPWLSTACQACPDSWCGLVGTPWVYVESCDNDGDAVTVDLDVVALGQSFTGTPAYSRTGQVGQSQDPSGRCGTSRANCSCFGVAVSGLSPGSSYHFAVRVTDAMGAVAIFSDAPNGWATRPFYTFSTRP